ncbi:MAG: hypothetical protein R2822_08795 [Spirosomataceae bacterium]
MVRTFGTKKLTDGRLLNRASGKIHRPNKKYGFRGQVYLLTNGGSFRQRLFFHLSCSSTTPVQ